MTAASAGAARRIPATVVGAGLMGRWHADALERTGGRLSAVVDPDQAAARRLCDRYAGALPFATLDEAVAVRAPAVVHVCTPLGTHAELVEAALRAGAHVLVEKPLAPDATTSTRLLDLAEELGLVLCPCHQYVFQRGTAKARRAIDTIGPLVHAETTACSAGGHGGVDAALDRIADEILPHPLSVLQALLPGGIEELPWRASRPRAGELRADALAPEPTVSIVISMNGRPPRNELRLIGAHGTAKVDFFHGFALVQSARASRMQKLAEPFHGSLLTFGAAAANLATRARSWEPAYPGLRALVARMYSAAGPGGLPPISRRDAVAVAGVRDRLIETHDRQDP